MSLIFGIIMCAILIPTLSIMFFILYPKNWKTSKLILGVSARKEYTEGVTAGTVDKIYTSRRSQAKKVVLVSIIIAAVLLLLHGFILQTTLWMLFFFAALLGLYIPFFQGNKEMKSLKKRVLGLTAEKVSYTDLQTAGSIRTIRLISVLIPVIICFLVFICSLLIDLKVIPVSSELAGNFLGTSICAVFFGMSILISVIAYMMDGLKNEVISTDSAINANYNRAKKKNLSNSIIGFLWMNTIITLISYVFSILLTSELFYIISILVYMVILMAGIFLFAFRNKKIETRYRKEMTIVEDEDDYWIGGTFYYNPNNKRLNVNKRVGVGATINLAHPAGKVIGAVICLMLIFTLASLVYIGMAEATPIKLKIEDNKLVCHHLTDDYVIGIDEIRNVEWGDDVSDVSFFKISGFGISNLYKGNFTVNGENGCKVFLNPEEGSYIKVTTDEHTYYISAATPEETRAIYEALK